MASDSTPRSDAVLNRTRLLDVAERYFAVEGCDASLHALAHHAGLGIGTVYRHFPTRQRFVQGLLDRTIAEMDDLVEAAADRDHGWERVVAYVDAAVLVNLRHPALHTAREWMRRNDPDYRPADWWTHQVRAEVHAAHQKGQLRPGATVGDVLHLPYMLSALGILPDAARLEAVVRARAVLYDGMRHGAPTPGDFPPWTAEVLRELVKADIASPQS